MSGVHRIRLQAAWHPPAPGDTAWIRSFGRPAGLEPGDLVWLVIERPAVCTVELNGAPLPDVAVDSAGAWRFDVTRLLADRNELRIVTTAGVIDDSGRTDAHGRRLLPESVGAVAIEIDAG